MPAKAKTSAPTTSAPASQREESAVIQNPGDPIVKTGLTDLLLAELGETPERPEETETTMTRGKKPARKSAKKAPTQAAEEEAEADTEESEEEAEETETDTEETAEEETETEGAEESEEGAEETEEEASEEEGEGAGEEEESEEEASEADELGPKVSPALKKRFHRLTTERNDLRTERDELKRKLEAKPLSPTSSLEAQVRDVSTAAELDTLRGRLEQWEEFAIANPEGLTIPGQGDKPAAEYTAEQVRAILVNTRRALRAIPGRERFLAEKRAADAEAVKAFPAYRDPDSSLSKAFAAVVERAPGLEAAVPDLKLFVADALRGRQLRQKGATRDPLPGRKVVRDTRPPSGGRFAAPARAKAPAAADKQRRQAAALARAEKQGGEDALAALMEERFG